MHLPMIPIDLRRIEIMEFPERLAELRKQRGLTQAALAKTVGIHVTQLRRYEAGTSQPTLDVLKRIAIALRVSADLLLFDKDERGPDDDLKLQFEAITAFSPEGKTLVREVLDSLILKEEAKRWATAR